MTEWVKSRYEARLVEVRNQRASIDPLGMEPIDFNKKHLELIVMQRGYEFMIDSLSRGGFEELSEPTNEEQTDE